MRKHYSIFMLVFCCSILKLAGQNGTEHSTLISEDFNNTPIRKVLSLLTEKYNYAFGYSSDLPLDYDIVANFRESSIIEVLPVLFDAAGVEFKMMGKEQILLRLNAQGMNDLEALRKEGKILLSGKIVDALTRQPLENAAIYVSGTYIGSFTNLDGSYYLTMPESDLEETIVISLLGYERKTFQAKELLENKEIAIMQESYIIDSISIISLPHSLQSVNRDLSVSYHKDHFYTGAASLAGRDVFREIQLLSGVSAHNDNSAEIIIRGCDQTHNLIVLDGIPIYNSDHFYGIFSNINSSYIDEVSLYKNTVPIEYGGKTGGMVMLHSDSKMFDQFEALLDLNLLYTSASMKIPLSEKVGLILAGRSTLGNTADSKIFDFTDAVNVENFSANGISRQNLVENVPTFSFNDWNAKMQIDISKDQNLNLNFFKSNDSFENSFSTSFRSRTQTRILSHTELFSDAEDWNNLGFSINHFGRISPDVSIQSQAFYSSYDNAHLIESAVTRRSADEVNEHGFEIGQYNQIAGFGWQSVGKINLHNFHEFKFGLFFEDHDIAFRALTNANSILDRADRFFEAGLIVEDYFSRGNFQLTGGARICFYEGTNQIYPSPRILMTYYPGDKWSLKSSFNINHQFDNKLTHENQLGQSLDYWVLANGNKIPVSQSYNYMLGGQWADGSISFDLELFYKNMDGVLDFSIVNPGASNFSMPGDIPEYRLVEGTGKAIGMDALLKYEGSVYTGWFAYTLSKVTNQYDQVFQGASFPTQEDRRHQLKWVNQISIKNWMLHANYIFTSGKPYLDYNLLNGTVNRKDLNAADLIVRLPNYNRIDLGINYRINLRDSNLQLGVSVFNLFDTKNVKYLQYIYALPISSNQNSGLINAVLGAETDLLDRTWNLNVKIEF